MWETRFVIRCLGWFSSFVGKAGGAATVHYAEQYPNTTGGNVSFSTAGWSAHRGSGATDVSTDSGNLLISNLASRDGAEGYAARNSSSAGVALIWTQESAFAPIAPSLIESITFYSNNSDTTDAFRIAVRIDNGTPGTAGDDTWHATDAGFIRNSATGGTAANWSTNGELESFAFTTAASAWRDLNFSSNSALGLATSARTSNLPAGSVNAVGVYLSLASNVNTSPGANTMRFDSFTVNAVPEPGVASAIVVAGGLLLRRRRGARVHSARP